MLLQNGVCSYSLIEEGTVESDVDLPQSRPQGTESDVDASATLQSDPSASIEKQTEGGLLSTFGAAAKWVGSGAKKVGGGVATGAKKVGGGVATGVKKVGGGVASGARTVGGGVATGAKVVGGGVASGAKKFTSGVKRTSLRLTLGQRRKDADVGKVTLVSFQYYIDKWL